MPSLLRTGSLGLDILLGGGWKPGSIHEIWGEPGSGKTTLAQHAIWELPSDAKALWMSMGTEIPHRPSKALLCQPRNAEQAFYIMGTAVMGDVQLIVVDSANGLVRQRELDGDPDYVPHPQREYKDELNGLKAACKTHGAIVIFLSKPRDRDRQPIRGTGISEKAKDRVELKIHHLYQDDTRDIKVRVKGNDEITALRIEPGLGIDWALELAHLSIRYELAERRGAWIYSKSTSFQGLENYTRYIEDNPQAAREIEQQVRSLAGI